MENQIYKYSPTLQFDVGEIGQAVLNLAASSPTVYIPYLLYSSTGNNGIQMNYFINDKPSVFQGTNVNFEGKLSYDIFITLSEVTYLYVNYPSGEKDKFVFDANDGIYKSQTDGTYVKAILNEETSSYVYILYDLSGNRLTFNEFEEQKYCLVNIEYKSGKKVIINRDANFRLSSIINQICSEKAEITYNNTSITVSIYRLNDSNVYQKIYEYNIALNNNDTGLVISSKIIFDSNNKREFKKVSFSSENDKLTLLDYYGQLNNQYTFNKDSNGKVISFVSYDNATTFITYSGKTATITTNYDSNINMKYCWDHKFRLTHIYDLFAKKFKSFTYDVLNRLIIESCPLDYEVKENNPNFICDGQSVNFSGDVNDLVSVILRINSSGLTKFKIKFLFEYYDEDDELVDSESLYSCDYLIENEGAYEYVYSSHSNIKFNKVTVFVDTISTESTATYQYYLYNACLTRTYLYKDNYLIYVNDYGNLVNNKNYNSFVKSTVTGKSEYDSYNRIIKNTSNDKVVSEYEYDDNWNITKSVIYKKKNNDEYLFKTVREFKYNKYNEMIYRKCSDENSFTFEMSYNINGLPIKLTKKKIVVVEDDSNDIVFAENSFVYNAANYPNPIRRENADGQINYNYENEMISKIRTTNKIYNYNANHNRLNDVSLNFLNSNNQELSANKKKFVEDIYSSLSVDNQVLLTEILVGRKENNGTFNIEYNDDASIKKVTFLDNTTNEIKDVYNVDYSTINRQVRVSGINVYNNVSDSYNYTSFIYNSKGQLVGKQQNGESIFYSGYDYGNEQINKIGNSQLFIKTLVETKNNEKLSEYIRLLNSEYKVCDFEVEVYNNEKRNCAVFYNNIIDSKQLVSTDNVKFGKVATGSGVSSNYLCGENTKYYEIFDDNSIEFSSLENDCNYIKQVVFESKRNFSTGSTNILIKLTDNFNKNLYVVQNNLNSNVTQFLLCFDFQVDSNDVIAMKTTLDENEKPYCITSSQETNFISVDVSGKPVLYVNGQKVEYNFAYGNFQKVIFGYENSKLKSIYKYVNALYSTKVSISNIMIIDNETIDETRLNKIYKKFTEINFTSENHYLDFSKYYSVTTKYNKLKNTNSNLDVISFDKSLTSSCGMEPKINPQYTRLTNHFSYNELFNFDFVKKANVYRFNGRNITYVLDDSKYNEYSSYTFDFLVDNVNLSCSIFKLSSSNVTLKVYYEEGKIVLKPNDEDSYSFAITKGLWQRISVVVNRLLDNCSNQVNALQFDVYLNGSLMCSFNVEYNIYFFGFNKLELDYEAPSNTENNAYISNFVLCDNSLEDVTILSTNYINRQFNASGKLVYEKINHNKADILEKSFTYCNNSFSNRVETENLSFKSNTNNTCKITYSYETGTDLLSQQEVAFLDENGDDISEYYNETHSYFYNNYNNTVYETTTSFNDSLRKEDISYRNDKSTNCENTIIYSYDSYGNVTSIVDINSSSAVIMQYDSYGRLTQINKNNVISNVTYNDVGEFISLYPTSIGDTSYQWEGNKLIKITNDKEISFSYNENGLRTCKKVKDEELTTTHEYFYDLSNRLICEYVTSSNGDILKLEFLYQGNDLTGFTYNGESYYYVKDAFNTVRYIINSTGQIVVYYIYSAFGKSIDILGEMKDTIGVINPFRYKGYYYDVETQLYWVSSRYYSPELCRWISPDSIEYLNPSSINGLNLYSYANNNPIAIKYDSFISSYGSGMFSSIDYGALSTGTSSISNQAAPEWLKLLVGAIPDLKVGLDYLTAHGTKSSFAYATAKTYRFPTLGGTYSAFTKGKYSYGDLVGASFRKITTDSARGGFGAFAKNFAKTSVYTLGVNFAFNLYENNWQIDDAMIQDTLIDTAIGLSSYYMAAGTMSLLTAGALVAFGWNVPGLIVVGGVVVLSIAYDALIRWITGYDE